MQGFVPLSLLDLEEGTNPVLYLDQLERIPTEMDKLEIVVNDEVVYRCFFMGPRFVNDVIRQRFSGKKLVSKTYIAADSIGLSELSST